MPTARLPIDAAHRAASSDAHAIGAVTGLTDALAGKAAVAHETALTGVHGITVPNADSIGVGEFTMTSTTGAANAVFGHRAAQFMTTAQRNAVFGYMAKRTGLTGSFGVFFGYMAGYALAGDGNVAVGYNSARYLADGSTANETSSYGTYVGFGTKASVAGVTNETAIGNQAIGGGSNTVRLGNASVVSWLPGDTNKVALGSPTLAFKEQYMTDGTNTWKLTVDATGPVWTSI